MEGTEGKREEKECVFFLSTALDGTDSAQVDRAVACSCWRGAALPAQSVPGHQGGAKQGNSGHKEQFDLKGNPIGDCHFTWKSMVTMDFHRGGPNT